MTQIVLTPEQNALLSGATHPILVIDARGRRFTLDPVSGWTPAEIADMERWGDSGEPGVPFDQVMSKIGSV